MSNNMIRIGNLDMLRSLYDFKATYAKTLSFRANDYFILHQTTTKHKNWWEVINEKGEIGFIPSNYVETITVSPAFYLQYLDNCIENLRLCEISPEYAIGDRKELIARLKEVKRHIEALPEVQQNSIGAEGDVLPLLFENADGSFETLKSIASRSPCSSNTSIPFKNDDNGSRKGGEETANAAIEKRNLSRQNSKKSVDSNSEEHGSYRIKSEPNSATKISPVITHQSVFDLVESVRINTQLSHEMSRIAVTTVVQGLHELLPASVFPYLSTILTHAQTSLISDDVQIEQTHDASRLKIIFSELTSCKEDSQQRSWMLHEDECVIKEYISELISILSNADANISKHVISASEYHVIGTLIQYYQMEVRWSIRQLLLQAFGVLCSLDKTVVNIMLNSVLPGELARDMMANPRNIPKLNYSVLLLTMIFSMGEQMPVTHLDLLGVPFISFILDNIENPPDTDIDEQIPDLFLSFILSFNLQFKCPKNNVVLRALEERSMAQIFTQKILFLFNRDEDPVRVFDHEPAPPNSLLKLFTDLFSDTETANLFYTNDIKILIDIVVRFITDLSPGDQRREQCLELCRRVIGSTNYEEHLHRRDDLLKCFTRIFCEESELSRADQKLTRDIVNEFPQYFK